MSQKIDGIEGALEILHGHVGNGIHLTIHSKTGNEFYAITNKTGAQKWMTAMSSPVGVQPEPIHDGRILIRFTIRGDDTVEVIGRDVLRPGSGVSAVFSRDQVEKIKSALSNK